MIMIMIIMIILIMITLTDNERGLGRAATRDGLRGPQRHINGVVSKSKK